MGWQVQHKMAWCRYLPLGTQPLHPTTSAFQCSLPLSIRKSAIPARQPEAGGGTYASRRPARQHLFFSLSLSLSLSLCFISARRTQRRCCTPWLCPNSGWMEKDGRDACCCFFAFFCLFLP